MITEHHDGDVRYLSIDRPDRRNALTRAMTRELTNAVRRFNFDATTRVLVITGTGDRAFCAGADLKEMASDQAEGRAFVPVMPDLYEALLQCSKPTIAALNGDAVGGGFEIALACDVRVASRTSRVGLTEAISGMVPRFGAIAVATMSSVGVALELTLSGALIPATRAVEVGLVNRVTEPDGLKRETTTMAEALTRGAPAAVAQIKRLLLERVAPPLRSAPSFASDLAMYESDERRAGLAAFAARQEPTEPKGET